ncbi:MAG: hypothetical protein U1F27_16175 [Turneriella sp.]
MSNGGIFSLLARVTALLIAVILVNAIFAAPGGLLKLKDTVSATKNNICLHELVTTENLSGRETEKLQRYCQITLKGDRLTLSAKEIELYAWAAGVTPDKITGGPVTISKATSIQVDKSVPAVATQKIRRGSELKLLLKSEHMQIVRDAAVLSDTYPGEVVDVRPQGTRKTLKAKVLNGTTAELVMQ